MRGLFFLIIASMVIGVSAGVGVVKGIMDDSPDVSSLNIAPSGYATIIYDSDGNELQKLVSSNANRMAVSIDKVPEDLQNAVVAIEDERFYKHNGIDPRGIIRAIVTTFQSRMRYTQGGSTITQQLLKNNVFTTWTEERTWTERIKRKIQEQHLAVELEKNLKNKKLILENYLNTINLGAGTYGVQAAAKKYFNKDVWDLTLSEASVIAGITQNPSSYNPIRHPEKNKERRDYVLYKMKELGYITEEEEAEALADDVYSRIEAAQLIEQDVTHVYSYFVDELTAQVVDDLISIKGYTETQAYQALYSGGLRIFTTQDPDLQKICDEEFLNDENYPNATMYELDWALSVLDKDDETVNYSKEMLLSWFRNRRGEDFELKFATVDEARACVNTYKDAILTDDDTIIDERISFTPQPQASLVLIDQESGYVKAIVGARGVKTASLTLNRATNTYRQPGSTFKPISAYASGFDSGKITLGTTYKDEPWRYDTGEDVHDWLTDHYLGVITVREAIINSLNIPAIKALSDVTIHSAYEQLEDFGITSLSEENDMYQPLVLGAIYNGVSNLELTAAYAAIANDGIYTKPIFYTKILDQYGNVIIDNTPERTRAIKSSTSFLLTDAMESVVKIGTGMTAKLENMPVAGKTGTTQDYHDVWFVGYTPYYTCGIWTGYDNNSSLQDVGSYRDYAQIMWHSIMERIHSDLPYKEFTRPDNIVQATICEGTGALATSSCPKAITEYFTNDTAPTERCTKHPTGKVELEDYMFYRGYGSGGNGTEPGAYALGINDLGLFSLDKAQQLYDNYLAQLYARLRALEEARRQQEEAAKKAAEAAAAANQNQGQSQDAGQQQNQPDPAPAPTPAPEQGGGEAAPAPEG